MPKYKVYKFLHDTPPLADGESVEGVIQEWEIDAADLSDAQQIVLDNENYKIVRVEKRLAKSYKELTEDIYMVADNK
jgi:hypothetical protein